MKILTAAAILIFTGCSNPSQKPSPVNKLTGTWQMTEHYFDTGDGNGQWWQVDSTKPTKLEITKNLIIRNGLDTVKYKLIDSAGFYQFQTHGDSIKIRYEFRGDTLELRPPCIEGCGERYVRLKES